MKHLTVAPHIERVPLLVGSTPSEASPNTFDVLIVGSGLAGLSTALKLLEDQEAGSSGHARFRIAILTKGSLADGSSGWAQGGIAAVLERGEEGDSFAAHIADTQVAGAWLSDKAATAQVVEGAPAAIAWLQAQGVAFTQEPGVAPALHLTREGGHSHRRIVHATDATGAVVQESLIAAVRAHPAIDVFEQTTLVDLIVQNDTATGRPRCVGLYALDSRDEGTGSGGTVHTFAARDVLLATGGAGKVYLYTSNPDTATGDGIAAAWRAGCRIGNMEFIQFHPTCLYHPEAKSFLISEAVRGEGGLLRLPESAGGARFMPEHDERAELAPRDVVARAIDFEMKKHGVDCVYLDISHKGEAFVREHFPTIHARCLALGIDIARQPIPVVPAAHYTCGGVLTDLAGRTDIANLYAAGETACTGLHGANRLASNSLVECVVFAQEVASAIKSEAAHARSIRAGGKNDSKVSLPAWDESQVTDADEQVVIAHNWDELRRLMWNYVGIVRTNKRLERAAHRIALLQSEIDEFYAHFRVTRDLLELRNLVQVAELIVRSAQSRHESRGLHFSRDYPQTDAVAVPTVLVPPGA
ncbi:MAG: L-aspartate oxidase [Burkholderiales bacterium]|jgi:L-aspartate oxidase|uniref:L-aspartate oxidase n=1 Tax=Comamonadaceae TaxID=80864 RepID=UPI000BBCF0A2|nr:MULTISPECIES: L-aspartate oxidase [Comamonadaceae]MBY0265668.1 L-aspartate oxidase [Burkholderiales bacterium]MDP2162899.1 L-aspartate oxidase [Hydrogenophaga sp.]MDP3477959.1 L-aspartate oxidase [Hydrogenophaga sp.]PHM19370.1 MAG: L-aspartate oxidase [Curvibacter sp. PD_MW3]